MLTRTGPGAKITHKKTDIPGTSAKGLASHAQLQVTALSVTSTIQEFLVFLSFLWLSCQINQTTPPRKATIRPTVAIPAITTSSTNMASLLSRYGSRLTLRSVRVIDADQLVRKKPQRLYLRGFLRLRALAAGLPAAGTGKAFSKRLRTSFNLASCT